MSDNNRKKVPKGAIATIAICALLILGISAVVNMMSRKTYNYSEIVNKFKNQQVVEYSMNLSSGEMDIYLNDGQHLKYNAPNVNLMYLDIKDYVQEYDKAHPDKPMVYNFIKGSETSWLFSIFLNVAPILIVFLLLWFFVMRRITVIGGDASKPFSFGRAKTKKGNGVQSDVKFDCVAGADEEKEELVEVVDFLKNPKKYSDLGARIPKGILLVGPPGTGKTLLAKAVAGEADVPFYSMAGSDFVEMFVGVGASRVRDLFEQAKKNVPCVIFIDEIDAVGRHRGSARFGGGNEEREQTLNQLLVEMDGFETNEGIIVIAATNRHDILDPALVRPGRFDRSIFVGYPDIKGREAILHIHAKGKPFDSDVKLRDVAKSTVGFTGADLENLLNESALLAARRNKKVISNADVKDATMRVIAGPEKRSHVMSEEDKKVTAYHESGHAVVTHFCKTQDPVYEVSIIPRGHAGGYTMSLPEKDSSYIAKTKLEEEIATLLGGRVAEEIIFNDMSTGAFSDLQRATKIARSMVTEYGMSTLGPIVYESPNASYDFMQKPYSDDLASKIDSEMKVIIDDAYSLAKKIIEKNMDALDRVAKRLLEDERIDASTFISVVENREIVEV